MVHRTSERAPRPQADEPRVSRVQVGARCGPQVWDVLRRSGRFSVEGRHAEHYRCQRPGFAAFNQALDVAPSLGHQLAWRGATRFEATLSACRLFSGTQVIHHLAHAGDRQTAHTAARELVARSLELCRQDGAVQHVAAHLSTTVGPFYALASAFAQDHAAAAAQALLPAHYYEFSTLCVADAPVSPPGGMHVAHATAGDLRRIASQAAALWGRAYAQAHDLMADTLATPATAAWQQAALPRERAVALACTATGRALAACVLDLAAPGSDLFHGFDLFTFVPLSDSACGTQLQDAHRLLVAYAKNWFLLRGAQLFTYAQVQPQGAVSLDVACAPGAIARGRGAVWVVGRPLFAALMAQKSAAPRVPHS